MRPVNDVKRLIRKRRYEAGTQVRARVLSNVLQALDEIEKRKQAALQPNIWRTIMKNRITKLAAAAVIIVGLTLFATLLDKSATTVYAIAQTIEANRGMRYLHTRYSQASHEEPLKQCWLEFDAGGKLKAVRIQWAEWHIGTENIVVWTKAETKSWYKQHNRLHIFTDEIYNSRVQNMTENEDLRLIVEHLHSDAAKGQVELEIDESSGEGEPIVVTATYLAGSEKYGDQRILFVDRATKLVTRMELYVLKEDEYKYLGVITYHDYNVPIDNKMFGMDDEIPADVEKINTATEDIGLAQGTLTDDEVAVEVVRQYLEALIAEDFVRACQIWDLTPSRSPAEVESKLGGASVVRIVSIGEPEPHPKPSKLFPKVKRVLLTIELEKDGKKRLAKNWARVNRVLGRRERWVVQGPRF